MTSKVKAQYIITQGILYLIAPVASFIVSLRFYKNTISQVFFVLFAFYFGYQTDIFLDLNNHYNILLRQEQLGFFRTLQDPECLRFGMEPYHFILKEIVLFFSDSSRFFAGCAAAIYATMFLFFINQYKSFYAKHMLTTQFLAFLGMVFTIEYYWYTGVRYWTGAFFFLGFFSKYIVSNKKKYLYLACLCPLFHAAHLAIIGAIFIYWLIGKRKILLYLTIVGSFAIRFLNDNIINIYHRLPFANLYIKPGYLDEKAQEAIKEQRTDFMREQGNIIYQNRSYVLLFLLIIIFIMLWNRNKHVFRGAYHRFYTFLLSLIPIVNISYADITAYERIFKFFLVLCFSYLFLVLQERSNEWINKKFFINFVFALVILFSILTAIVQEREYLFAPEVWFSNLYTMVIP